jgi:hypothetical protein
MNGEFLFFDANKYNPGPTALLDFKFLDTRAETPRFGVSEIFATFTGWSPVETKEWEMLDFVLEGVIECGACFFFSPLTPLLRFEGGRDGVGFI